MSYTYFDSHNIDYLKKFITQIKTYNLPKINSISCTIIGDILHNCNPVSLYYNQISQELYERLSKNAIEFAKKHDMIDYATNLVEYYKSLLNSSN
jgi:lysyl-tRNA synthetase class I